ncbi:hypothetical protein BMF28_17395 [Klebsiella pneumoniae]|nr:hypothetical protein RJF9_03155 [Klebsiella pneumoniae subsp. pneumoniae]AOE29562.1 hypothetical protein BCV49_04215 [Klebsiella pneumoniae]ATU12495.1 hypothetical protein BMF28_17395 [Klebsiella pneumoniae]ODN14335.1 hypothetical protein BCB67_27200 [Klebsiella pneumoniae]ODP80086.1 hypothetical protein A9502_27150 [Klebsiella pneumoniae]
MYGIIKIMNIMADVFMQKLLLLMLGSALSLVQTLLGMLWKKILKLGCLFLAEVFQGNLMSIFFPLLKLKLSAWFDNATSMASVTY